MSALTNLSDILATCKGGEDVDLTGHIIKPFYLRGGPKTQYDNPVKLHGGTYQGTALAADTKPTTQFRFDNARGIEIHGAKVQGVNRENSGIFFNRGFDCAVHKTVFEGLLSALSINSMDGFTAADNSFRNLRKDGFTSGGSRRVLVTRNMGFDFYPKGIGGNSDHPDFIQFWPLAGLDNSEIEISYNILDGELCQGIFVRGIYADRPRFGKVIIKGNVIRTGLYNGMAISGVAEGEITDNIVLRPPTVGPEASPKTWFDVNNCEPAVVVKGNISPILMKDAITDKNIAGAPPAGWTFPDMIEPKPEEPKPEEPKPEEPKPEGPTPVDPAAEIAELRAQIAELRSRFAELQKRAANIENMGDQLRYHTAEFGKILGEFPKV